MTGWTHLEILPDVDREPLPVDRTRLIGAGTLTAVGLLRHATTEGNAGVGVLVTLDDGRQVIAQTTWRLFNAAARALAASPIAVEET